VGITLRGVESKRVWLLGRFQAPGVYPMAAPTTLLEAISIAGGSASSLVAGQVSAFTGDDETADLQSSFVLRDGKFLPVDFNRLLKEGDLTQNIYLQPDDFVYLRPKKTEDVYVMGAVFQPGAVPFTSKMTVAAAIAHSYGIVKDAFSSQVAIVRGSLSSPKIAIVDYKAIAKGKVPDIELEPRDIVYVPYSPFRYIEKYAELIVNTFVTSVAINEGTRAVVKDPPTATGILIPLGSRITVVQPSPPSVR
jgi:polysaccharide export outer membrane protein